VASWFETREDALVRSRSLRSKGGSLKTWLLWHTRSTKRAAKDAKKDAITTPAPYLDLIGIGMRVS
jgi:hypothetical protein